MVSKQELPFTGQYFNWEPSFSWLTLQLGTFLIWTKTTNQYTVSYSYLCTKKFR